MLSVLSVVGVVVGLVLLCWHPNENRALPQAKTLAVDARQARAAAAVEVEVAKASARAAEGDVDVALSKAAAARARARIVDSEKVLVSATPDAMPVEVPVPAPVAERMRLDSTAVATLGTLVRWKDTVIVRQDLRISADSLELAATSNAFHALERVKEPRCGRRCGILLGVGGMLAAAVAVEQVRRTFR